MSYKVYLWNSLTPIEWSQAAWRKEGGRVSIKDCEQELICDVLLRHLPRDGLIVDAGCGTGKWPIFLRRRGYRVIGIDICYEACRIGCENDPGFAGIQGDVRQTPLKTGSVDAVLSLGVVEHDEAGPTAALRETRRILRPGGTLVLAVPYNNLARRLVVNHALTFATWRRRRAGVGLGFNEYRFSRRELRRYLREVGFEPLAAYPNDLRPPKTMGLWVDYNNIFYNPLTSPEVRELFVLPGLAGRAAGALMRWAPWAVCGEVVYVARAV